MRSRPARDAIKFTVNMETLLAATEQKDEKEILKALQKVEKAKELKKGGEVQQNGQTLKQSQKSSVNLGRKTSQPAGGFTKEGENDLDPKKQKTDNTVQAKDEESSDMFNCENCGS